MENDRKIVGELWLTMALFWWTMAVFQAAIGWINSDCVHRWNRNRTEETEERTIDHPRDDRVQASAPQRFPVSTCFDWVKNPPRDLWVTDEIWVTMVTDVCLESHIIYKSTPWRLPHSGSCRSPAACPAAPLDTTTRSSFRTTRRDATHEANNSCGARRGVADLSL